MKIAALKDAADERQSAPESLPATSPRRYPFLYAMTNVALVVVVVALSLFIVWERIALREDVHNQLAEATKDLEQLRTDMLAVTSENDLFLKILVLKPGIGRNLARDISRSVSLQARAHRVDPDLVLSIIDVESDFNPAAVSVTGARGLMQIMPFWKETLAIEKDLSDVDTSINYGLKILGFYQQTFGSLELALTAYNKGPTQVTSDMKAGRSPLNGYSDAVMQAYSKIKSWSRAI